MNAAVVTWDSIVSVVLAILTMVSALGGVWWRVHATINAEKDARIKEDQNLKTSLLSFQIESMKTFATMQAMRETESRILAAIDKLGDRLDAVSEGKK